MAYPLTFRVLQDYKDQPAGITVPRAATTIRIDGPE